MTEPKLTGPQRDALRVMFDFDPLAVGAHKRKVRRDPVPMINMIAAGALCRAGLVRRNWRSAGSSVFVHGDTYSLTDEGRRVAQELALREGS